MDHRLWTLSKGNPCNNIKVEDGVLKIEIRGDCRSDGGKVTPVNIISNIEYKYGYMEAKISKPLTGEPNNYGIMNWSSYGRGESLILLTPNDSESRMLRNFLCRGNNRSALRKRWLDNLGVEYQYLEMFNNHGAYSSSWMVFHSIRPRSGEKCYDGTREIYSGVYFADVELYPGDGYTLGVEWTPSGYRIFINGIPYGQDHVNYQE